MTCGQRPQCDGVLLTGNIRTPNNYKITNTVKRTPTGNRLAVALELFRTRH
jgi:hypothetical protein